MKKAFWITSIALLIAIIGAALYNYITPTEQGLCQLKHVKNKFGGQFNHLFSHFVRNNYNKPETILDLPDITNPKNSTRYFTISLGKNVLSGMIVEESKGKIELWLDKNLNGRLADEKPILSELNKKTKYNKQKRFLIGPITTTKDHQTSSQFYLFGDMERIGVFPAHYYAGKIKLSHKKYKVVLLDTNFDGKLDKPFEYPHKDFYFNSDTFGINLNNDRTWQYYSELTPLTRFVKIQDKYYDIKIRQENEKNILSMNLATPKFGTLDIGQANSRVILFSDADTINQNIKKTIKLPVGKYYLHSANLEIEDEYNKKWIYSQYSQPIETRPRFEISDGKTITLDLGGPFTLRTEVRKYEDGIISINPYLENNAGKRYGVGRKQNGGYLRKPSIKIFNENGDEMVNSHFKYG